MDKNLKEEMTRLLAYDFRNSSYSYNELLKIIHFMKEYIYTTEYFMSENIKENKELKETVLKLNNDINQINLKIKTDYVLKVLSTKEPLLKRIMKKIWI